MENATEEWWCKGFFDDWADKYIQANNIPHWQEASAAAWQAGMKFERNRLARIFINKNKRVSVEPDDRAYLDQSLTSTVSVFLEGDLVDYCLTADEQEGFVLVYVLNSEGGVMFDDHGQLLRRVIRGKVEIRVDENK